MQNVYDFDVELKVKMRVVAQSYADAENLIRSATAAQLVALDASHAVASGEVASVGRLAIRTVNARATIPEWFEQVGQGQRFALSKRYYGYNLVRLDDGATSQYGDETRAFITRVLNKNRKDKGRAADLIGQWAERNGHFARESRYAV